MVGIGLFFSLKTGKQHGIRVHGVNDLFMAAAQRFDIIPVIGIKKRLHGLRDQRFLNFIQFLALCFSQLIVFIFVRIDPGFFIENISVKGVQQVLRDLSG